MKDITKSLPKKDIKVVNGMPQGTKKKFISLVETITKGIDSKSFKDAYDVSEMWIPGYEGKNIYRVKFDFRFRAFVKIEGSKVEYINVVPREGAY